MFWELLLLLKLLRSWKLRRCSCTVGYFRLRIHPWSLILGLPIRVAIRTKSGQRWNLNCVLFMQYLRRPNVLYFNLLSEVFLPRPRGSYICLSSDYRYGYGFVCCWYVDESVLFLFLLLFEEFVHVLLCFFARCNDLLHVIIQSYWADGLVNFPWLPYFLRGRSADAMLALVLACRHKHLVPKFRSFHLIKLVLNELFLIV